MNPNRAEADDVESNAPAPTQGSAPIDSRLITVSQGGGEKAREAFLHIMKARYMEFIRTNPNAQPPPPPPIPQPVPVAPQEFRVGIDDDPERVEFWLENTIRVLDELSSTLKECMKCVVSLLRDLVCQWWNTLVSIVPRERVNWEFFQKEFRKKYINQRFIYQK
ncbi:maturase K [Gossypium australe]|uniref:Maturase K n=1 Tax=Gossypium australe TaxID=47621 RepID=A0A5B6WS86_9ROSI|nr:maturase K [Gossypium australe]